jgi:hypothetical protein
MSGSERERASLVRQAVEGRRVERANQTPRLRGSKLLQDRLIEEMRLPNISSMEVAQAFLPAFMLTWNARFAVEPRDKSPAHRPWTKTVDELDLTLARRESGHCRKR